MTWLVAHFTEVLAAAFAVVAVVHIFGGRAGADSGYPHGYRMVNGSLLALAAGLLAFPPTRLVGLAVAALELFLSATTLLHRRQYGYAAPVIVALFALIPVTLAASI